MFHHPFVAALLLAAAAAQQPGLPHMLAPTDFQGVAIADPLDCGTTWVRGERYKLALANDAVTFQPLFGPQAPRDFLLQLPLLDATAGGVSLKLAAASPWVRTGQHFERNRGSLRECWDVQPGAAQQYFVVDRPPTAGDLQLCIGARGDLRAIDDGPGVRFLAAGLGHVHYSDAVVFDAAGRQLDLPVRLVERTLTITVPAAFVADAAWPLVIDPLVTTVAIDTTTSSIEDARVTCEPSTGNWLVVAEEHLSATDVDIVCKRYDSSNPPNLLDTVYAEIGGDFCHNPDVGFSGQTQQFVIAWHNATGGNFQWRTRTASSVAQGSTLSVSQGIGSDLSNRPRIGSSLVGDRFLLVLFRRNASGSAILAAVYRPTGTNFGTLFVGPMLNASQGTMEPGDVSTIANLADKWVVVWRECSDATCNSQLVRMQALVSNNGFSPLTGEPTLTLATGGLRGEAAIAGHGGQLLATWRAFDTTTNSNDIHGVPIGISGGLYGPLGAVQNLSAQEPNVNNLREQTRPSVSYDGIRFVYGYLEDNGNDTLLAHCATVFTNGGSIAWHEGHLPLSSVQTRTLDLGYGANGNVGVHWAAWQQDSATFTGDVLAAVVDARKPGISAVVDQTGCGLPSEPVLSLTGTPAIGRSFTVSLTAPGAFPMVLVGQPSIQTMPGCNGCRTGIDTTSMLVFLQPSITIVVPPIAGMLDLRLGFQGLAGLQTGGCPASYAGAGFDFALSDTISVQIR